jgi:hypothetical protein
LSLYKKCDKNVEHTNSYAFCLGGEFMGAKAVALALLLFLTFISGCPLYSQPLDSWRQRLPSAHTGVTFGNGLFAVVGINGQILTSPDCNNWLPQSSGTDANLTSVTYANGLFVALGENGLILISSDGFSWTQRSSGTHGTLSGVAFGNGVFAAVGEEGEILSSSDGYTWTKRQSGTPASFAGICFANGIFMAAGNLGQKDAIRNIILISSDGATWRQTLSFPNPYRSLAGVAYGNGIFVAAVINGPFLLSSNGTDWTWASTEIRPINTIQTITYGNGTFLAVGQFSDVTPYYSIYSPCTFTSQDGSHWNEMSRYVQGLPEVKAGLSGVAAANGLFIAVDQPGLIATSIDGTGWSASKVSSYQPQAIAYGPGIFVAVGNGIATSPDGAHWTEQSTGIAGNLNLVVYGNDSFVAIGNNGLAAVSHDGLMWVQSDLGTEEAGSGLAFGNGLFVATGNNGLILTSPDGLSWTLRNSGTTVGIGKVAFGNGKFLAFSQDGILESRDGIQWTQTGGNLAPYNSSMGNLILGGVAYGNGLFVAAMAGGYRGWDGLIETSSDGITWIITNTVTNTRGSLSGIVFGAGIFVAIGPYGNLMTSSDGRNWTHRESVPGSSVAFGNNTFVVAGRNSIMQSDAIASPIYRFYNWKNGDHFYTANEMEKDLVIQSPDFIHEGPLFYAFQEPVDGALPAYRFYDNATGNHFYTINSQEKDMVAVSPQFSFEGAAFYAYPQPSADAFPVYRFYDIQTGAHFYTINEQEKAGILSSLSQLFYEGVAFYSYPSQ